MTGEVKRAARRTESSRGFRAAARSGYVANGVVHILIGILFVVVAFGGEGQSDQAGALEIVLLAPLGVIVVWTIAVALGALAVYHALECILARESSRRKTWGRRVGEGGQVLAFSGIGAVAVAVALGARPDADEAATTASRGVLALPGGGIALGLVGVGFGIAGATFVVMGIRRSFRQRMSIPDDPLGRVTEVLGVTGFAAKGVALAVVGTLFLVAGVRADPENAGGLDAAVDALVALPWGAITVGIVGGGLVAYGVFCLFRARFARL